MRIRNSLGIQHFALTLVILLMSECAHIDAKRTFTSKSGRRRVPHNKPTKTANVTTHRKRLNSTVSHTGGGSGFHAGQQNPIIATKTHGVQSSSVQQLPVGATYHSPGSLPAGATYHHAGVLPAGATYHPAGALPAGATYHPAGALPAGATYHPAGALPAGATYHPAGALPAGATYHSPGALPAGATYHPVGALPAGATYHATAAVPPGAIYHSAPPAGASFYPQAGAPGSYYHSAVVGPPPGATFLPAGAALPAGATYYAQPPMTSSSSGFGSGLVVGAIGGAILDHVLTPTKTRTVEHVHVASGGSHTGSNGGGHGNDKIIIINNGPPGSVTTTNAGSGTTIINAGVQQSQAPVVAQAPVAQIVAPSAPPANMNPVQTVPPAITTAQLAPLTGIVNTSVAAPTTAATPAVAVSAVPATPAESTPAAAAPAPTAEQPPAGGIICVPVRVPQPDPNDSTKTIEVEQIACYPAPPPEATTPAVNATVSVPEVANMQAASQHANQTTTIKPLISITAPLAPLNALPLVIPEGAVPLAPFDPSAPPDIMIMPGVVTAVRRRRKQIKVPRVSLDEYKSQTHTVAQSNNGTLIQIIEI